MHTWTIPGVSSEQPLIIFDPDTKRALNQLERQRPGIKWLVYPREYELQVTKGQKLRSLPQQYGEWGKYQVEVWDLPAGSELKLHPQIGNIYTEKILNELAVRRPFFRGGIKPLA